MGISGLLPLLKDASRAAHVRDHKGKTFAVDGASPSLTFRADPSSELATGQHRAAAPRYVNYAMERIRMLRHFGIEPYVVFDGGPLPSKRGTEDERAKKRAEALAQATACVAEGNASLARDWYLKAVDVTPQMAFQFIKALRTANVSFVVAPYEADAQLAYLEREGLVDGVITEDSDLLVYGCKTVLYKLDNSGSCTEFKRERFTACREYNMHGWTDAEFRHMAILSGCDYVDSINGLGLKMAYKLIKRYKSWVKAVQSVRLDGKLKVPSSYERDFRRAEVTFLHQLVFDPRSQKAIHFTPLPAGGLSEEHLEAVGGAMEPKLAKAIARGEACPCSRKPMVDLCPNDGNASPQAGPSKPKKGKASELAPMKNRIDGYFPPRAATPPTKAGSSLKRGAKRPALDELNRNTKRTATEPALGAAVQSKFFASSSKSAPIIMNTPIDVDADDDEGEIDVDAILRDVEPPPRSDAFDDEDALDALRELEAIGATDVVPTSDPVSPAPIVKTEPRVKLEPGTVEPGGSDISSPNTTPQRSRALVSPPSTSRRATTALSEISISSPPTAAYVSPAPQRSQVSTFKTSPASDTPTPESASTEWHQRFSFVGSGHGASSSTSTSSHRPIPAAPARPPLSPVRASAKRPPALTRLDWLRYRP